ncbi:MMPL family transporter [Actinoplanes sp. M2I2]|uniref:MMPL family transporter n=1 Tax=Actinoplanes sp. M2I2 TaxID=1734444 RepID=UPI002020F9FB|nr:MMPL family transporter [Actinoplanes sp. M2I2]
MNATSRFVARHRWWVLLAWLALALAGGFAAPKATAALSYDFSLPGQRGYETNRLITERFGSGGDVAPVLLVDDRPAPERAGRLAGAVEQALPGSRVLSYADEGVLRSADGRLGVVVVYPRVTPGPEPYAAALPVLEQLAGGYEGVTVTGKDALAAEGGGEQGADVLVETIFGGAGALIVLLVVFGSALALMPLLIAAGSILTTFLIVWGLTGLTDISFIVQFLLALIGLGVAIDYALLIVTRWREELGRGAGAEEAVHRSMATAGRSVFFSGVTVAVSLAALIALPVPFLRSVGFTGLLIPVVSVLAALTLLPALLLTAGPRLDWPHRRRTDPESRLWRRIGAFVVRHRWASAVAATVVLLALAAPALTIRLGQPTDAALASTGGDAGAAVTRLGASGIGAGLTTPVEILTADPAAARDAVAGLPGVAAAVTWPGGDGESLIGVWTTADASTEQGAATAARVRAAAEALGARVGGLPAGDADFIDAVYGNAWWVIGLIAVVTVLLLVRALRSVVLPIKALLLNVLSLGAAYGITVWIWQYGHGTELLFGEQGAGTITTWVPIAVFAFLFGLSMDYEVFLLSRIREEYDNGSDTDEATVRGVARTGRLVTSAALILFLAFVSLAQVPTIEVKMLATALALGIVIDATIVRGVLAPALVAALGRANWWSPR